jgi:hypothetical protein
MTISFIYQCSLTPHRCGIYNGNKSSERELYLRCHASKELGADLNCPFVRQITGYMGDCIISAEVKLSTNAGIGA